MQGDTVGGSSSSDAGPEIVGLPADFELTPAQARALEVDRLIEGISLRHGLFEASSRLLTARRSAEERQDWIGADALQLLILISQLGYSDEARAPFGRRMAGHFDDGRDWHTPLPEDLTGAHVAALQVLFDSIRTPSMRAKLADVLWHRCSPRNVDYAREATTAYLIVADQIFDADEWVDSERQLERAFRIASQLGPNSPEMNAVLSTARSFLTRLQGNDQLYYTERIVRRLLPYIDQSEAAELLDHVLLVTQESAALHDFDRSRTYFDVAIPLARIAGHPAAEIRQLRLDRAETHVSEAAFQSSEMLRALSLRMARQALLDAGAPRERVVEVSALLDDAQRLSASEATPMYSNFNAGVLPELARDFVANETPQEAIWQLAALPILQTAARSREAAEATIARSIFAFGFSRRHLSRDGRQDGVTPGAIASSDREGAIRGAMRFHAVQHRIYAVIGAIEPARAQLRLTHEYSIAEIYQALRSCPLIPEGHLLLFAKGLHAGLVGDFDVAIHILAPQLENALREILRRHGAIVYGTTSEGVQSLLSLESVLEHDVSRQILGDDYLFAVETTFSQRLGANVRNNVAHGLLNDANSNSIDAIYAWWLTLRLLLAYGRGSDRPSEGTS